MKKILFLGSTSFGDRIASIPYLIKMRDEGNDVYLLEYGKGYVNYLHKQDDIYNLYKDNNLYKNLFVIPHNKIKLIGFLLKNFRKFDLAYAPTWTFTNNIRGLLFGKKWKYTFKSLNDNSKYDNFVSGMKEDKEPSFFEYRKKIKIPYSKSYYSLIGGKQNFATFFVGPYSGSIESKQRNKIIKYTESLGLKAILLGSDSLNREGWIVPEIYNRNVINLLGETDFEQCCSIISDAKFTVSANGGIMRLSHLLNENSISFSTTSGSMIHPPVDNKKSFHINSLCSKPCELKLSKPDFEKQYHKKCIYHGTTKEGLCKNLKGEQIINLIKNYF